MPARGCVVVVVPAHNESDALPRCLEALRAAAGAIAVPVYVVVVADACEDDTMSLAGRFGSGTHFVRIDERNVGAARAAGFRYAADSLGCVVNAWYATTDADSEVDRDWLRRQLDREAEMVLGVVRVHQWRHYPEEVADRYEARYGTDEPGHRHIHGANMGFSADAYFEVGGFAPLASGEDVDLVERFEAAGRPICWDDDLSVATSDRRNGRAPGGFADHLAKVSREALGDLQDEMS